MSGEILTNLEGREVGMLIYRIYPIYEKTDYHGNPVYRFELVEVPMLFKFPNLVINICDN